MNKTNDNSFNDNEHEIQFIHSDEEMMDYDEGDEGDLL